MRKSKLHAASLDRSPMMTYSSGQSRCFADLDKLKRALESEAKYLASLGNNREAHDLACAARTLTHASAERIMLELK